MKIHLRLAIEVLVSLALLLLLTGCCKFFRGSNDVTGLSIGPTNTSIQPGNTQQFSATGTFGGSSGGSGDITARTNWKSSDPTIATIDGTGLATGIAFGTVTISGSCQCYDAKTSLSVSNQTVNFTSIAITPANSTIQTGRTQQFTATASYSNGTTNVITNSAVWSSSDNTIATVTSGGLATGITSGNVTITATSGSVSGTTTLTVQSSQPIGVTP